MSESKNKETAAEITSGEGEALEADQVTFADLHLDERLVARVSDMGFEHPTPIQAAAIGPLLHGHDIIGRARTGSGKTAAFGLPMLHHLIDGGTKVRGICLAPTRELALQVTEAIKDFAKQTPVKVLTVYGGASYDTQLRALKRGVSIVVGTPGRTLDLIKRKGLDLSNVEIFVLDEADEMLRMGFIDDVDAILAATPKTRQVCLFSATMPKQIRKVADRHLNDPMEVQVEEEALTTSHIAQYVLELPNKFKVDALARILESEERDTVLVFCRTRRSCAETADRLAKMGVPVDALHGDLNQAARERVLSRLRSKQLEVVIATDIAARGIDVNHITHVVNYDIPDDPEIYVHRIGRTGRAGRTGKAISFIGARERPRMRRFAKTLDADFLRYELPSDLEVHKRKSAQLNLDIKSRLENEVSDPLREAFAAFSEGMELEDVAASLYSMVAEQEGVNFNKKHSDKAPTFSSGKSARNERPDLGPEAELELDGGRNQNIGAGDIVGAIANDFGMPGGRIGRIQLTASRCFISMGKADLEKLLSKTGTLNIRGNEYRIRAGKSGGRGAPRGGGPRGGGSRRPPPGKRDRDAQRRGPAGDSAARAAALKGPPPKAAAKKPAARKTPKTAKPATEAPVKKIPIKRKPAGETATKPAAKKPAAVNAAFKKPKKAAAKKTASAKSKSDDKRPAFLKEMEAKRKPSKPKKEGGNRAPKRRDADAGAAPKKKLSKKAKAKRKRNPDGTKARKRKK